MSYWNTTLANWPLYSQLADFTIDGNPDENKNDDCGPECVSMAASYLTGVHLYADEIHDDPVNMLGQGKVGTTTEAMLRNFLVNRCSTPTTNLVPTSAYGTGGGTLLNLEWSYTVAGKPLIVLRWWSYPNSGYRHWCCVVGIDPTYVYVADPWTGQMIAETYDRHSAMYQGTLIGVDRTRDKSL